MVTLYKRATPSQQAILRAVEGAIKNVADCHPEYNLGPKFARSVAKRAAGTLYAQWLDIERKDVTQRADVLALEN